ncbi:response regulator receiver protein [Chlorobium sp. N1]|uniref:helix-turn-helix transcriptional regulator n=1 Tax=Chlorobium sp. N1 TaxID=2491138 RepID=UPI00103B5832|nr:response regulator receiver protein [Chlorobium sp. N1]TCD47676.1 response regulator receiver protein [Chlorobium sp. N1]
MSTRQELAEQLKEFARASAEKAAEIERATGSPGGNQSGLTALLDMVKSADVPAKQKKPITKGLLACLEHEQLESRVGTILTNADAAFLKTLQERHPNLTHREYLICLFAKLGYDTREIARYFGISVRGTESIRYRLHKKLGRKKHEAIKTYLFELK